MRHLRIFSQHIRRPPPFDQMASSGNTFHSLDAHQHQQQQRGTNKNIQSARNHYTK